MERGVSMPVLGTPIHRFPVLARAAEDAGMDSVWSYEFYRDPFMILGNASNTTQRITLGTGLATALIRSPFAAANAIADVDELSGGRALFGLGVGSPDFLEAWHSTDAQSAVPRMREYLDVVRLSWDYLRTQEPTTYQGKHYRFQSMPLNPWGDRTFARHRIPIILAATGPKMTALAGEAAEGVLGYTYTPKFLAEHVMPNLTEGLERAGRNRTDVKVISYVICSVSDDVEVAWRRARIHVGTYFAHPTSDAFLDLHGLQKHIVPVREGLMTGGLSTLEHTVSDKLVEAFSVTGTPADARAQLARFGDSLDHVILHTPYVPPLRPDETEDAFRGIIGAFGRSEESDADTCDPASAASGTG